MNTLTKFKVRVRAVIVDSGELLVVRIKKDPSFACLPGGKVEFGDGIIESMKRELEEELGITPELGTLLFAYSWMEEKDAAHNLEYFFEVKNAAAYRDYASKVRTHAHELASVEWLKPNDGVVLRPSFVRAHFDAGTLISPTTRVLDVPQGG